MSERRAEDWRAPADTWWLGATASCMGDAPALDSGGDRSTFAELAAAAEEVAATLAAAGIARGARVGLISPPSRRAVEIIHATQRIGASVVPLSHRSTLPELAALVAATRPQLLLVADTLADGVAASGIARDTEVLALSALDRRERERLAPAIPFHAAGTHSLVCTSGTTGTPKAVMLSHANHHASALAAAGRLDYRAGQRWLAVLPLHHVGGLAVVLRAAILGAEVLLRSDFDADETAVLLAGGKIAQASLVPTMLHRLLLRLDGPAARAAAYECRFIVGGAALDEELAARAHAAGFDVRATYGMTETASQVATSEEGELACHPGTSGRALDGVELRVASSGPDGFGELLVRGVQVARRFLDDAGTERDLLTDRWLHTGDLGRIDDDGRLFVGSRRVDLIVSGGENVRPEEVERVLVAHPAIAEAGVYGVRDAEWGQRVAAVVVPRDGARIDAAEVVAWCRSYLAAHKLPREIDVAERLPRTASGKLRRRKLASGG